MQKYRKEEIITHVPASKGNDKCHFLDHFFPCYAFLRFLAVVVLMYIFIIPLKDFTKLLKLHTHQFSQLTITKTSEPVQFRAGSCWERGLMSSRCMAGRRASCRRVDSRPLTQVQKLPCMLSSPREKYLDFFNFKVTPRIVKAQTRSRYLLQLWF